jgi:hypothetical protein
LLNIGNNRRIALRKVLIDILLEALVVVNFDFRRL